MNQTEHLFRGILPNLFLLSLLLLSDAAVGQSALDRLERAFEKESNDSLKIVYELELSRQIHRQQHDKQREYYYAEDAIGRALQFKDTLLYARALDNLGLLYRYHQQYQEALSFHSEAFHLIQNRNVKPVFKMIFANNAGVAGRYDQQFDLAISFYVKALKIAEAEDDLRNIAISSNGIGNALGNIPGRKDEALKYFQRSLKAERKRNNSLGIAMNYLSIADYYIDKHSFKRARKYLDELLEINRERQDSYGLALTNEFLGLSYLKEEKNLDKASTYFKTALGTFRKLRDDHKQASILFSLGDVKLKQDQLKAARAFYKNSLAMAKQLNQHALIMENSFRLSALLESQDQPAKALAFFKLGKAYEDSIKLSEQNVEIAALIRKYDIEKKEDHIELLQKDKALQQTLLDSQKQELERRMFFILVMGIGLFFILIIFFLQYRNIQVKKKTSARILEEEKEKMKAIYERNLARAEILVTRLRINPHFIFNSLNAITYLIQSEQNLKAVRYLVVFSRYTRMVLETSQKHVVPLVEELKLTEYYLTLEENRFEKNFSFRITGKYGPGVQEACIPPLLLQPFIENAIWHGLLPSNKNEKILHIKINSQPDSVQIIVDDNGAGRKIPDSSNAKKAHRSMGMQITQERIALYNRSYSGKIEYKVVDKRDMHGDPEGTQVVINLLQQNVLKTSAKAV